MTQHFPESRDQLIPLSIFRRLAAFFYDSLLCLALLMTTTGLYMIISSAIMGAEHYQKITESGQTINDPLLSSILFITAFLFFGYFWTKNGQTLGMQAWHLRVQNTDNSSISWKQALKRFLMSIISIGSFGLGIIWPLIDKQQRSWQCIYSKSEIVRIPKKN